MIVLVFLKNTIDPIPIIICEGYSIIVYIIDSHVFLFLIGF